MFRAQPFAASSGTDRWGRVNPKANRSQAVRLLMSSRSIGRCSPDLRTIFLSESCAQFEVVLLSNTRTAGCRPNWRRWRRTSVSLSR